MRVLLLSAVLYLLGVAVLLYFRPVFMFHRDGSWKEFGLNDEHRTPFPFWMFCLAWAVGAFGITLLLESVFFSGTTAAAAATATAVTAANAPFTPPQPPAANAAVEPLPIKPRKSKRNASQLIQTPTGIMQPGYYMLDTATNSGIPGVPRYIYIGPEAPGMPLSAGANNSSRTASVPVSGELAEDMSDDEQ